MRLSRQASFVNLPTPAGTWALLQFLFGTALTRYWPDTMTTQRVDSFRRHFNITFTIPAAVPRKSLPSFRTSRRNKSSSSVNVTNEVPLPPPSRPRLVLIAGFSWFSSNGPISSRSPRLSSSLPLALCPAENYASSIVSIRMKYRVRPQGRPCSLSRRSFRRDENGDGGSRSRAFCTVPMWHLCVRPFGRGQGGGVYTRIYGTNCGEDKQWPSWSGRIPRRGSFAAYDACTPVNSPPRAFVHTIVWRESSQSPGAIFFFLVEGTWHRIAAYQM